MAYALQTTQLSKTYDGGIRALKGIDLEVAEGDFFALLGPNGAGKSTAIGVISSLVKKTGGRVHVFGVDIDKDFARAKSFLGVVPQEFNFNVFESSLQIMLCQAGYYGIDRRSARLRAEQNLRRVGLWENRHQRSRDLSGGMKRRLMIARALVHEPRLLILDEPTAGVDIEIRRSMWDLFRQINAHGTTIILTTHYLEEAESLCRNIAIIDQGLLVENTSMRALLGTLSRETFILDLDEPLNQLPGDLLESARLTDENTLEVDIQGKDSLNSLYARLSAAGIRVRSMRNKSNRLEQLFVNLIDRRDTLEGGR
ncbi:MAG: ABC transporter ATP-binding protein [Pseudomonadota bacterium]|nr:MAG: ABC transporter ATP-binding protein [Pseudomonadota bacterium]